MTAAAPSASVLQRLALPALIAGACLTGLAPIFVRLAADGGGAPLAAAFWRFAFSLPILAAWAAAERRTAAAAGARPWSLAALSGVLFAGDLGTWHAGIMRTDVANATLLVNLTPVLVGAAAWLWLGERPCRRFLAGGLVALAGAALLSGAGFGAVAEAERGTRALGDLLSALTAVWYAAYMLTVKAARGALGAGQIMLVSSAVGAAVLGGVALALGIPLLPAAAGAWLWLALLGLLSHAGGQGAIAFALGRLPAGFAALMILVQPLIGAAAAWILFDEILGPLQLFGGALVLAGLWTASRAGTRAPLGAAT